MEEKLQHIKIYSPHAPKDGEEFAEPACSDCFCSLQEVHAHTVSEKMFGFTAPIKIVK